MNLAAADGRSADLSERAGSIYGNGCVLVPKRADQRADGRLADLSQGLDRRQLHAFDVFVPQELNQGGDVLRPELFDPLVSGETLRKQAKGKSERKGRQKWAIHDLFSVDPIRLNVVSPALGQLGMRMELIKKGSS